jgi:hypothetical protein
MRGDKRRTYRFQDDQVVDHVTGKSMQASKAMKGGIIQSCWDMHDSRTVEMAILITPCRFHTHANHKSLSPWEGELQTVTAIYSSGGRAATYPERVAAILVAVISQTTRNATRLSLQAPGSLSMLKRHPITTKTA